MTTECEKSADLAESYVSGLMTEPERSAFEDHFFVCDRCFRSVRDLQAIQQALADSARQHPEHAEPAGRRSPRFWWTAAAASLVLVVATFWYVRQQSVLPDDVVGRGPRPPEVTQVPMDRPAEPSAAPPPVVPAEDRLVQMARVDPPRYIPLPTRSSGDEQAATFSAAMAPYTRGDYAGAARQLEVVARQSPDSPQVQFYLGITELMTGNTRAAHAALERCRALGIQPYADEARFYLAKTALAAKDRAAAERELRAAVRLEAGPPGEAARLLKELRALDR